MKMKNTKPSQIDNNWSGSEYHKGSTMPSVKPLEAKPSYKPGAITRAPTPTLVGQGVKRAKP
jgi:hypothetical protein